MLIDNDVVEECNLQRQFYGKGDIAKSKCLAAYEKLKDFSDVEYKVILLDESNVELLQGYDLVLDCTDNMKTRFIINDNCKKWVYSSAIKNHGYVMPMIEEGTCLRCFLKEVEMESCDTAGVMNTITTSIAALQVNLAIKMLIDKVDPVLYYLNLDKMNFRKILVKKKCEKWVK